jgi:DNA-binding NarL/FixJ family response regulator
MPSSAAALAVPPAELAVLRRWASAVQAPATLVRRAKLLLLAAEGVSNTEITERLGISRPHGYRLAQPVCARGADRPAG